MDATHNKSSATLTAWALMPIGAALALAAGGVLYGLAQMPLSGFFVWAGMTLAAVVAGSLALRQQGRAAQEQARHAEAESRSVREALQQALADQTSQSDIVNLEGQVAAINRSQAVIEFELDGTIRHANDNFLAALGYSLEEIKGQHHRIFVDASESATPEYAAFWDKLGRGEFDAGQYKRLGKGGTEIWIQASYNPVFDAAGQPMKVVKYATDVTAQVKANAAVKDAVEQTRGVVVAAQAGDLSQRIDTEGKQDAMLDLCQGINDMLNGIEENRQREQEVAAENLQIRNALDNVSGNVMIANSQRTITYMNKAVMQMMRSNEDDLRKELPSFKVDNLINGSIDQFHKNPSHQAGLLENLRETYRAQIKVGSLHFALIASPIITEQGEHRGTVVEWIDRTAEVAVEEEIGTIVAASSRGEFDNRVSLDGKTGFFASLAQGINQLLDTCQVGFNDVIRVLGSLAEGDLTQKIEADYQGTFADLKNNLNRTIDSLTDMVVSIKSASDDINSAATDISAGGEDLSSRTEEQAASLEETASSMEELTSTVKQNADNAKQANQLAIGASDVASKGGVVVGDVVTRMSEITESSKKIEDIISVIEGIAFQTNILALNAAVEAARAGEQGRGFAVVASEVRSLAQRSSGAAKEIKQLISDSVERIEDGSKLVEQAGSTMEDIVTSVKRVTDIMAEISAASQEQSSGIEQVNQTIAQMDDATQQNAALVEESSASAKSMMDQGGQLAQQVSRFQLAAMSTASQAIVVDKPVQPAPAPQAAASAPKPAAKPAAAKPVPVSMPPATDAQDHENWTEF